MEQYTIYCTEEQTRKALELGAPIHRIPIGGRDESKPSYFTKQPDEEGWAECPAYYIPTAEQMIGWLEDNSLIQEIDVNRDITNTWYFEINYSQRLEDESDSIFPSRKEATFAAIDAALEYLSRNKK